MSSLKTRSGGEDVCVLVQIGGRDSELGEGHLLMGTDGPGPRPGPSTFAEVQRGRSCASPPMDRKPQMAQRFDLL